MIEMVLDQQVQSNSTNYINQYLTMYKELEFYLDSSMPNIDKQNKLLSKINILSDWIRNDNTISDEDKHTLLGDELYN